MKHIKLFESISGKYSIDSLELFREMGMTDIITIGSDFYAEGPQENTEEAERIIGPLKNEIKRPEPQHSYYYQDAHAVDVVYEQNKIADGYREQLAEIGWVIIPCILAYYGSRMGIPGIVMFSVMDKEITIEKKDKTLEELKEIGKNLAREHKVTHIGIVAERIPVNKWDGMPY